MTVYLIGACLIALCLIGACLITSCLIVACLNVAYQAAEAQLASLLAAAQFGAAPEAERSTGEAELHDAWKKLHNAQVSELHASILGKCCEPAL